MSSGVVAAGIVALSGSATALYAQAVDPASSDVWTQVLSAGGGTAAVGGLLWVLRQVLSGGLVVRRVDDHDRAAREQLERTTVALEAAAHREAELRDLVRELRHGDQK